jgi:hypothetical protein
MKTHALRRPALPLRVIAPAGAILLLTAFAPPEDRPPPPALAQQVIPQDKIPKSWIPEFPKKDEDPLTFRSTPQAESAIAGDSQLGPDCPIPLGARWGEATGEADAVQALIKAGKFEEALAKTNRLARLAETAADRYLILTMLGSIYEKSGNKPGQAEALRALVAGQCFLVPGEKAFLQKKLDALGKPSN